MSLVLGVYCRDKKIDEIDLKSGFENFTHSHTRKTESFNFKKFRIDIAPLWAKPEHYFYEENGINIWVSGDIHSIENKSVSKKDFLKIVLHSYLHSRFEILSDLTGEFTIIIYDQNNNKVLIANDVFGLYPLFVSDFGDYFVFCNEYEPITKFEKFNKGLNHQAIAEYFVYGFPLGNKTFFKNLENIEPATLLQCQNDKISFIKFESISVKIQNTNNPKEFASDISAILKPAVSNMLHSPEKMICTLTGGLDTRLILSNISNDLREKLEFVTILTPGLLQEEDRDILIAKQIAKELKLHHSIDFFPSWHIQYEKEFDISFFNIWREKQDKRGISGVYGTELYTGGWFNMIPEIIHKQISNNGNSKHHIKNIFKSKSTDKSILLLIFSKEFIENTELSNKKLLQQIHNTNNENALFQFAIQNITRGFFTYFHYGTRNKWHHTHDLLTNIVSPFTNKKLLLYLLSLPVEYLVDDKFRIYNELYKNHYPELIHIPSSSPFSLVSGNCIPYFNQGKEPRENRKVNYNKVTNECINDELTWSKNIFNKKILIQNIRNNSDLLNKFIDFETWYRHYVLNM